MFGMGFFAIFNPKLSTERVVVTTCCEGSSVEVSFHVETPGKCPKISLRVLDEPLPFSTRIEVQFNRITLLCKYERLTELEIASLGKGGHGMYQTYISVLKDLRHSSQSFQRPECPSL
jgi:hypothetical protein